MNEPAEDDTPEKDDLFGWCFDLSEPMRDATNIAVATDWLQYPLAFLSTLFPS